MVDPDFLDELTRLRASLKRPSRERLQGEQESPHVGEGLTFSDYRRYSPGDDTRLIDWHLYARTEEYFVKQFEEERNLTVHVLVDASASMDYGEGDANKFEFAAKLGLAVAYVTAEENNDFRLSVFRDRPERLDTGRSNRGELLRLVDLLNGTTPSGEADLAVTCEEYAARIGSKALVVVVSDFLSDPDEVEAALAALGRNDVVVAQVLTPTELDPDPTGDTVFVERERDARLRTYFGGSAVDGYRKRLRSHVDEVAARCHDLRATHTLVSTDRDFFDAFAELWETVS
jgi:uncharacterized protein (DUF58 family)